jgi:hypothetical protein
MCYLVRTDIPRSAASPKAPYAVRPPFGAGEGAGGYSRNPSANIACAHTNGHQVNRLTRELSSLRQQTASVASTTSSTSATPNESGDTQHSSPHPPSAAYSTPSGRHRSSSSLSSYIPAVQGSRTRSVSGVAPPRDASAPGSRPPADLPRSTRSRETSVTSPQQSEGGSLSSSLPHQNSLSQHSMTRFEEAALHRGELESIRRENETLRQRVRDLEHTVKRYREGSTETTDADTDETNASMATG